MPLPTPSSGETTEEFISRCMGDAKAIEEFPDESQRYAVCQAQIDQLENLKAIKSHILSMIDELPDRETNRD
jgi:hypothetical protein